ncbi:hypothetical protein TrST_g2224 [Triparma strigata]|uniref:Saccharopine dehydrogenase NADP binding domain-containing protein n=1 Tax=Triparma strigata TaxID=1606541 RepID=A0A9W7DTI2_9STRA|nr:hypothetical protein TrST_g2224 [Triparma strigata]
MWKFLGLLTVLTSLIIYNISPPTPLPLPSQCVTSPSLYTPYAPPPPVTSSHPSRDFDIIVYGATGFTGKLVMEYYALNFPSLKIASAGRSLSKLSDLTSSSSLPFPYFACSSIDLPCLLELSSKTRVLISLAGPYTLYGSNVVRAAAESGTHYVDLSGEFFFHRKTVDELHGIAEGTGAKIIIAGGFDSVPFDLGSQLVLRDLGVKPGSPSSSLIRIVSLVTEVRGWLSGGTLASMIEGVTGMVKGVVSGSLKMDYANDPYITLPEVNDCLRVDTEATGWGSFLRYDGTVESVGMPHFMAYCNSRVIRRSFYYMRQGRVSYSEGMSVEAAVKATWWAFKQWLKGEVTLLPKPGEGPGEGMRRDGGFEVKVVGISEKETVTYKIIGRGDPGYEFTSKIVATVGLCLSNPECERDHGVGGVMTVGSGLKGKNLREMIEEVQGEGGALMEFKKL